MSDTGFTYSQDDIKEMSADVLKTAKALGASQAEAELSLSLGQSVSVRKGETEILNITAIRACQSPSILANKRPCQHF